MGKPRVRYVVKAESGLWQVWDRKMKRTWGNLFASYPEELLAELNGPRRPERITELSKPSRRK